MRKIAFFVCFVGMIATGYGLITYVLKSEISNAFLCSSAFSLYLWSLLNLIFEK